MESLALAANAANPTFISQYGPLIAAAVALSGVIISLIANGRREKSRYQNEREDDYRRAQRTAIASIAVAGHHFRRECAALTSVDQWETHRDSVNTAAAALLNELTVAKLLVYDSTLQEALDGLFSAWDAVCEGVDKIETNYLNQKSIRDDTAAFLDEKLREFDSRSDILHTLTLEKLRPTVAKTSR